MLRDYGTATLREVLSPAIGLRGRTVIRWSSGPALDHCHGRRHVPRVLADFGGVLSARRLRAGRPARYSSTTRLRKRICGSSRKPKAAVAIALRRLSGRANPGRRASSPTPSTASAAPKRSWIRAATRHRGVLTGDDMARWMPPHRSAADLRLWPLHHVQDRTLGTGSGDAAATRAAQRLRSRRARPSGPDFIHLQVECTKLAYADREAFYGDPDFVEVPIATLLSGRLQCSAAQARSRRRLAGIASGIDRRIRRRGQAVPRAPTGRRGRRGRTDRRPRSAAANQPWAGSAAPAATPCTSTSSIRPAIWCRQPRQAAGCNPRRSFPNSASASARGRRCSGLRKVIRRRSCPANGRAPRSRRRSRCATVNRISPGARPAAMRRINGSRNFSCAMSMPASICSRRLTRQPGIPTISPRRSGHARHGPACWSSKAACRAKRSPSCGAAVTSSRSVLRLVRGPARRCRLARGPRRRAAANPRGMQGAPMRQ